MILPTPLSIITCHTTSRLQIHPAYPKTSKMDVIRSSHCNILSLLFKLHPHPEVFCLALIGTLLFVPYNTAIPAYLVLSDNSATTCFKNILSFCFEEYWNGADAQALNDLVKALNVVLETLENDNHDLFAAQVGRGSLLLSQFNNL
ncbi:hypothetical protein HDU98_004368 [Podochytrium sp. JEL0797]|nr:hypothetical protein HDU98_004368 [Podochytrium sp. JEL0797]